MRSAPGWYILAGLMILLDLYVFQIIKVVSQSAGPKARSAIVIIYWTLSALAILLLFILPYLRLDRISKGLQGVFFAAILGLFIAKLLACAIFLIDDIRRGIQWVAGKLFFRNTEGEQIQSGGSISRSLFLSWLGLGIGGGVYASLLYGFSNKYNYKIKKVSLSFPNLPEGFRGIKIVQISDIHSGSFTNHEAVSRGVDKILSLQPDLILFTGDLVNNKSEEMVEYIDIFSRLKAPMGVYSILGNHDYGDYATWPSETSKHANLEHLKEVHSQMGWRLLMDEHVVLERNGHKIALIGIQNWSALKRFPRYGNLPKAYQGAEAYDFKLLMSHDPTHWDAEVRTKYKDIDLMLSGHTHGMQFGVELPWFRWSPVEYVYKQWAGLYEEGTQKLYVNRGYGFIGYPGRVGILPEITFIELS